MPPIRTMPIARPVRTERTHEENQERAYIAASRRSDRSLEARVESARRASEIHKKRTGRSLRVREEDVMNEEMYEEEDDDLPMQFRRINALHPGLAYNAFNERVNSYLAGQIGVRNYLHQAIYQANQSQYANQFLNPMMNPHAFQTGTMSPQNMNGRFNGQAQSPYPMPNQQNRSTSVASPQELANYQQQSNGFDARRMTIPLQRVKSPNSSASQPATPHGQTPQQALTPPQPSQVDFEQQMYPLTTKLPIEAQQLIDGSPAFVNAVHSSQLTAGIPMPSMGSYSYNPNGKSKNGSNGNTPTGLHQTLSPYNMHNTQAMSPAMSEPQSAMSAPANLDFQFNSDIFGDFGNFNESNNYVFDLDFGSGSNTGIAQNSGQATPNEGNWNDTDFFNYAAASD